MTQTATKERTLTQINRHEISNGNVVYRFANDQHIKYLVVLRADGTTGCFNLHTEQECKGHQFNGCCYHVKEAQRLELIDPEYEAWKKANGLDVPMTREQYVQANGIYGETVWTGEFFSPAPEVKAEVPAAPVREPMDNAELQWRREWSAWLCIDVTTMPVRQVERLASQYVSCFHEGGYVERPFEDSNDYDYARWTREEVA